MKAWVIVHRNTGEARFVWSWHRGYAKGESRLSRNWADLFAQRIPELDDLPYYSPTDYDWYSRISQAAWEEYEYSINWRYDFKCHGCNKSINTSEDEFIFTGTGEIFHPNCQTQLLWSKQQEIWRLTKIAQEKIHDDDMDTAVLVTRELMRVYESSH